MDTSAIKTTQSLIDLLSGGIFHQDGLRHALHGIVRIGRDQFGADIAAIFALNPVTGTFLSAPAIDGDLRGVDVSRFTLPRPAGLTRLVMERRSVFVEDLSTAEGQKYRSEFAEAIGVRSFAALALPTTSEQPALAVLYLDYQKKQTFSHAARNSLRLFADQAALIFQSLRLFESLRRVNDTGRLLTQELDSKRVLGSVVEWIRMAAEADISVLYRYDPTEKVLVLPPEVDGELLDPGLPQPSVAQPDDIASLMFREPKPRFVHCSSELYEQTGDRPAARRGSFARREAIQSTAALPLEVGRERVGVLFLNYRTSQRFDEPQKQVIQSLASFAAIAIRNSDAFKALEEKQLGRLKILRDIEREINSSLDSQQVLQTIADQSRQAIGADEVSILLYNERANALETKVASGPNRESSLVQVFPLDEAGGIVRRTFTNREPERIDDVGTDSSYIEVIGTIRSELDVPLLYGGKVLGVMNFESRVEGAFDQGDQDFLVNLAEQAVLAIRNAQAYEREKRIAGDNEALINISKQITSDFQLDSLFDFILDQALVLTRASAGEFLAYDPQQKDLLSVSSQGDDIGLKGRRQALDQGVIGWVARKRKPFHGDIAGKRWSKIYLNYNPRTKSELTVPLLGRNGRLRGVLDVESTGPCKFDERDLSTLQALADLAVIAIQDLERYERSQAMTRRLRSLHKVDQQIIAQADDPDQVIRLILRNALKLIKADLADLHLYDQGKTTTTYLASRNTRDQRLKIRSVAASSDEEHKIKRGIVAYVAETGKPYRTQGDAQKDRHYQGRKDIRSEVAVPLLSESRKLIGVLNLESMAPGAFDDDHVEVLELFAGQAVLAIQNAEIRKQVNRELLRFRLLSKAGVELGGIAEMTEEQLDLAYDTVIRIAREHSDCEVVIRRFNPASRDLEAVKIAERQAMKPFKSLSVDEENLNALVYWTHKPQVVHNVRSPPPGVPVRPSDDKTNTILITPIELDPESYYGNLALSHEKAGHFLDADLELFNGLAKLLALTINRLETVKRQREAEQRANAAEAMSSVGQSAFELAHRLGNYLGGVESDATEILEDLEDRGVVGGAATELLHQIVEDVNRVLSVSKDLKKELAEFRPEELSAQRRNPVPIGAVLQDAVRKTPRLPANVRLHLLEVEDPDTEVLLLAPGKVIDILHNLVSNAIDAMPEGGTIRMRARNTARFVEVEVSDTGLGIPESELPKLFNLFYSTKESTGFGLFSAKSYARAIGGDLKVASTYGEGTTFTLFLPRAESRAHRL